MKGQWDEARRFVKHDIYRDVVCFLLIAGHDFFRNLLFSVGLILDAYPYEWGVFQITGALIFLGLLVVDGNRWKYYG